jgi:hypothetical protein
VVLCCGSWQSLSLPLVCQLGVGLEDVTYEQTESAGATGHQPESD